MEQSMIQERKRLMEQAKKREDKLNEVISERDQFKNQLINHTK